MPTKIVNGTELYYEERGSGPETIVFSHGLLMSGRMFDAQVEALSQRYRCICYDHRGQARSAVAKSGYDMDTLTDDAVALIKALDAAPCHFVGLSMGGFVGMRLAFRHPQLLRSLVLMETSADPEVNVKPYRRLAFIGRWFGFRAVVTPLMGILFGHSFLNDPEQEETRQFWKKHLLNLNRRGTARAAHGVIDRDGVYSQLGSITLRTLVMVGDEDVATVPAKAERIHAAIAGSTLAVIPGAGHSASIEQPALVTAALENFFP
ncbi:alpha/beta fold hydrolase [Haliea sp. E17]|uniref:alpha/beta fold hydrolase n=1 Tax=Haliea sp. E17 TaxID=3401576 RepID=UPI003AAFAF90